MILLLLGCTAAPPTVTPNETLASGGTLRAALPADPAGRFTNPDGDPATLDPHNDAFNAYNTSELMRCCLTRTLLSNNGRSTANGGARIHPDLARSMPEVSDDGLTWTIQLKEGLRYAPPLKDFEITAPDFVRSFHRLLDPRFADEPLSAALLYPDIVGAQAYRDGDAASISGLETPDRYTLVIRLTQPSADFGPRLALPIVIPIPPWPAPPDTSAPFGVADGHDDGYGRFLVASGPYMIEGSADLDFSVPPEQRTPLAGLVLGQKVSLIRNPSWDRMTDDLREAHPDRIELETVPTFEDAVQLVSEARADLLLNGAGPVQITPEVAERVRADANLGSIHVNELDLVAGILINMAMPPFDDLFVRKAAAFAINRVALVDITGGPLSGRVAHHMVPDAMEDNLLLNYRPYPSPGDAGDVAAAREMMKQSRYDSDRDGSCDAAECAGVAALARDVGPFPAIAESVREDLAQIGIELEFDSVPPPEFLDTYADPTQHYAMYVPLAWAKDSLSPASFFVGQFYSPVALAGRGNGSLVGASPEQLSQWGYDVTETPNVDQQIEACVPLTGAAQFECWAGLDQHLMENVLPSISFGTGAGAVHASRRVIEYEWDQLVAAPSFDRIRLSP
jgi:ABC-type transport system substrate-binding protein